MAILLKAPYNVIARDCCRACCGIAVYFANPGINGTVCVGHSVWTSPEARTDANGFAVTRWRTVLDQQIENKSFNERVFVWFSLFQYSGSVFQRLYVYASVCVIHTECSKGIRSFQTSDSGQSTEQEMFKLGTREFSANWGYSWPISQGACFE